MQRPHPQDRVTWGEVEPSGVGLGRSEFDGLIWPRARRDTPKMGPTQTVVLRAVHPGFRS